MENLTRYYLDTSPCYAECGCYSEMSASESGEWVKFSDIKELLQTDVQQLKAEIAALAKRLYTFMDDLDYSGKELSDILAKMRQLSAV
jgi:septal ring factor EnvC (AmiA/AmiB activator)